MPPIGSWRWCWVRRTSDRICRSDVTIAAHVSSHEVSIPKAIKGRRFEGGGCGDLGADVAEEESREISRCGVTWRVDLEALKGRNVDRSRHGQVAVASRECVNCRMRAVSMFRSEGKGGEAKRDHG